DLPSVGQRLPALRAGRLVVPGGEAAPEGTCLPDPLRRRLRNRLRVRGGRAARAGSLAEAVRQVRLEPPPGQDAAGVVPTGPASARPGGAGAAGAARDVRLPGLHPLLGEVEEGRADGQAAHGSQPNPPVRQGDSGMVSAEPAPTDRGAAPDTEPEAPGPLRLLRDNGELHPA